MTFRPLNQTDFKTIDRWLCEPHIKVAWGNEVFTEPYEKYIFRTGDKSVLQYIIEIESVSIGYFQYYWASKVGDGWWDGFDEHTVGVDFYVGKSNYLGLGLGSEIIRAAKTMLFANPKINRIIADPSLENKKIIYLLGESGFVAEGEIDTPDGRALFMYVRK